MRLTVRFTKNLFIKTLSFLILFLLSAPAAYGGELSDEERDIFDKMENYGVTAVTLEDTNVYSGKDKDSAITAVIPAGHFLLIYEDYSMLWYYINETLTGIKGWVLRDCIMIPEEPAITGDRLTRSEIELYVNKSGFESATPYFVLTDIKRQLTYIFHGTSGKWALIKTFPCSTGRNESPTVTGAYEITERGEWFYSERLGSGAKHWIRFRGAYLFHSQAMDKNKVLLEKNNEIGKRVSNGCIRLYPDDAEWLYRNVPDMTTVFIH